KDLAEGCGCVKFNSATAIFFYAKPYRGKMFRNGVEKGEITFYNEREWRYVPFADDTIHGVDEIPAGIRPMLAESEYKNTGALSAATMTLHEHYKLTFGAEDVRYLIVREENELDEIVNFITYELRKRGHNDELQNCSEDEKKRLLTRLISMRQIE